MTKKSVEHAKIKLHRAEQEACLGNGKILEEQLSSLRADVIIAQNDHIIELLSDIRDRQGFT